ncbi:MAG: hypothetical protein M5U11_06200 [Anaerolineales bacterium]|nr:hypothetical protein [Anaerolineales bacterium]
MPPAEAGGEQTPTPTQMEYMRLVILVRVIQYAERLTEWAGLSAPFAPMTACPAGT